MSAFRAWHLPPGFPAIPEEVLLPWDGILPPLLLPDLSADGVRDLFSSLREAREEALVQRPVGEVVEVVDRVARRLLEPGDSLREEALAHLAPQAGYSVPMAETVLGGMARDWTRDRLGRLLASELPDPGMLDGFRPAAGNRRLRALGHPVTFHLGAGSVPGVATTSLIRALLVKSAVMLKPGRGDVVLPVVFTRGLAQEDRALARAVAVAYWPGADSSLTREALHGADLTVVYGGDETVRWVRDHLPATASLVAYRHRLGLGFIGREALGASAAEVALEAARAVALFDQRGCVSPHVFLVEEGGAVEPGEWGRLLAGALARLEEELPSGALSPGEGAALQQLRGEAEMRAALDEGTLLHHGGAAAPWTVLVEREGPPRPSCLNRVIRVMAVADLEGSLTWIESWRDHLQTVGVAGLGDRGGVIAERLARLGVTRVAPLSGLPWPPPWWHHDGAGPLRALLRWTDWEEGGTTPEADGVPPPDHR